MDGTQKDLFESVGDLPEWLHTDWMCQNRCPPGRIIDDYTLPSVQYSLPSLLKLSTFSFNMNMLYTDIGVKAVFRCLRFLYQQIAHDSAETAIIDLDRSLSYLTAFAQNMELNGDMETLNGIAREFKFFLVQAGSLSRYIASDGLFTTRNVETMYKVFEQADETGFGGFEKLYPMGDALSSTEQLSMLVSYGLLLSASRTNRPSICRCITVAWHQLYASNREMFWSNMVKLLGLCTDSLHYYLPESPSSEMFLDLCDIGNTVSAEIFLEIICEFGTAFEGGCIVSGKALSNYVECLQQITAKVPEKQYVLRKLYFLFDKDQGDDLLGTESILQYFFTYLCSNIMEPSDQELDFYPTSGKVWKDFLLSCCSGNTSDQHNDWMLFIRLMSMLIKSKHSDMEETSNKVISLATAAFDPSDKERHDVLIRAVQCTKYILDENRQDSSQAISTLIALMGKLDDKKDVSLYAECCMCIGEKVSEIGSLVRFLPSMNDMDLEQLLAMTAHCRTENSVLWNAAIGHLKSPNFSAVINYIVEQLAVKFERNQSAFQNMRQVVQNLLTEKSYKLEICLYFLREFLKRTNDAMYPVELIVPLWLVVTFEKPNTNELDDISKNICKNLRVSFRKNGLYFEAFSADSSSTILSIRWLFELLVREFPAVFVREVLPNYMVGMFSLPVHSVPYLLRVVSDVLEKHLDDNVLKEIFTNMLKEKPQLTTALYASSKVGTRLFNFVSQIK
uniref:MMS22L_N domain-containing protein n=1 Tax=Loa loa TaxID=7209 RepID=A0A1I7VIA1_LOALO